MTTISFQDVIEYFGNQKKTAEALKITQPSVNYILSTGKVSVEIALRIQKQSKNKFSALDLRPSLRAEFSKLDVA
ncbi:hypothetical protein J559_2882 [Acinetobacter sp. 983759]|uniref:YdaS family helix-turn-helix protein n=1 Tax=Acinetobacter sp. 983759 TaxID=1310660 RepID=UPI00044AA6A9|nr:YdaS family helix-turn-helix protein [Acinetobacter sp. 983759]EXE12893.1 hypothetical protein J559_2882 [Acinetobacter sp. 983759]